MLGLFSTHPESPFHTGRCLGLQEISAAALEWPPPSEANKGYGPGVNTGIFGLYLIKVTFLSLLPLVFKCLLYFFNW